VHSNWLDAVTEYATPEELPILAGTRRDFATLLADDLAPLRKIALSIMADPALALRVLQRANAVPHRHFSAEVALLEDAAHMLGIQTVLRLEAAAPVADELLEPTRLLSYQRSAGRAVLAALLAHDWAEVNRDQLPAEVSLAALLNHLGELFLLAHGDPRIKRYLEMMEMNHLLPHEAEYLALGHSLEELGHLLAQKWQLPVMVREAMRARNAQYPRTLCVMLATQIARHACSGWQRPTQNADLNLTAELLTLALPELALRINGVLRTFNQMTAIYALQPLKMLPVDGVPPSVAAEVLFCLAPRADEIAACRAALVAATSRDELLTALVHGLHHGLGLNRVVFAGYHPRFNTVTAEFLVGTDFEPRFNRFHLKVADDRLTQELLSEPMTLWINDDTAAELVPRLPPAVRTLTGTDRCFIASLWVNAQAIGIVYADRRSDSCQLDARSYALFTQLIALAQTRTIADVG
jgi:HD-like signal output (HDOD) protein